MSTRIAVCLFHRFISELFTIDIGVRPQPRVTSGATRSAGCIAPSFLVISLSVKYSSEVKGAKDLDGVFSRDVFSRSISFEIYHSSVGESTSLLVEFRIPLI